MGRTEIVSYVEEMFTAVYGCKLKSAGIGYIEALAKNYGESEVQIDTDIAVNKYSDPLDAIKKINGILFNRRKQFGVMFERVE